MKEESSEKIEYVSPYSIKNDSGYILEIMRDYTDSQKKLLNELQEKIFILENGESMSFQIEANIEQMFEEIEENDMQNVYMVKIKIKGANNEFEEVKALNLDRIRVKRHKIKCLENDKKFFLNSCVEIKENCKMLTISSPITFINETHKTFEMKLEDNHEKTHLFKIISKSSFSIPFDLIDSKIQIKDEEELSEEWSTNIILRKIISTFQENSYEIKSGKNYYLFRIKKDNYKTNVYIEPPYYIKNCLPINLEYQIFSKGIPSINKSEILDPQEFYNEFRVSLSLKLYIKIRVQGFKWSEKILLYSDNNEPCQEIKLIDVENNSGFISIYHKECFTGSKIFLFYSKAFILNQTSLNLFIYGKFNSNKKDNHKKFPLGGQISCLEGEMINNHVFKYIILKFLCLFYTFFNFYKIVLMGNEPILKLSEISTIEETTKDYITGGLGESSIDLNTNKGLIDIGINNQLYCVGSKIEHTIY